jgi:hypothetical protein
MSQDSLLHQPDFSTPPGVNIGIGNVQPMYQAPEPYNPVTIQPSFGSDDPLTWEMIGLGLDEPLPPQDVINEL